MFHRIKNYILFILLIFISSHSYGQGTVVFFEDFDAPLPVVCDQGTLANGFPSINGPWTVNPLGTQDSASNEWYISATEPGFAPHFCSSPGCLVNPGLLNRTLHIGNVANSPNALTICPTGDCGAIYDPGVAGVNAVQTLKRAESPVFTLPIGPTNVLIFKYLDYADNPVDSDIVYVDFFNGTTWQALSIPARTLNSAGCGFNSFQWEQYSVNLPDLPTQISNAKIGFRWKNDNGGLATSIPSFAVDSIIIFNIPFPPVAVINKSDSVICVNGTINFAANTVGPNPTYLWSFPGSLTPTSTSQNPAVSYPNPGTYPVTLTVTTLGGSDSASTTILVNPCVLPTADFAASDTTFCERTCITFVDASVNGPTGWNWSFPGGTPSSSSSATPPPICYNTPGFYNVTLIAFNQYGADTLTKTAYLDVLTCPLPIADFTSTVQQTCPQQCVSFADNSQFGPITSFRWSFPGGNPDTSSSPSPVICYDQEGQYDVQLIVTNQYGSDTVVKFSEVNVLFIANAFVSPDTEMFFGSTYHMTASGGLFYSWSPTARLDTAGGDTANATPQVSTVYTVDIMDGAGCIATRQVSITILHNDELFLPNSFTPNDDGVNDYFFVRGNNLYGMRLSVFDRWGEKVFETTDQNKGWDGSYKGKDLNPGVFTWVVTVNYSDKQSLTKSGSITLVR